MINEEQEKLIRVYILDVLISHSGKPLFPDLIGNITSEIMNRTLEVLHKKDLKE